MRRTRKHSKHRWLFEVRATHTLARFVALVRVRRVLLARYRVLVEDAAKRVELARDLGYRILPAPHAQERRFCLLRMWRAHRRMIGYFLRE